ncbi:MAG: ribosomal protein L29 [Patiriisocius sp.]|jgi:ribosomal protein L29
MSNYKDIQKKTDAEIVTLVTEKREALRVYRFSAAGAGNADASTIRNAKKEIAQSLTELNARNREQAKQKAQ